MHEVGAFLLVVSAIRTDDLNDPYGNFTRFEEKNRFVLEVIDIETGAILQTSEY